MAKSLLLLIFSLLVSSSFCEDTSSSSNPILVQKMLEWAKINGAYLHPDITYSAGGMFSTGAIFKNDLIASIPKSLEFPLNNKSLTEFTESFINAKKDKEHFWYPYFNSLPTTCQNFCCLPPDLSTFTVIGEKRFVVIQQG